MTYKEFVEQYNNHILRYKPSSIRDGQALMNFLADVWLEEYGRIASHNYYPNSSIDCFYNNDLIPNTLAHLEKAWENYGKD